MFLIVWLATTFLITTFLSLTFLIVVILIIASLVVGTLLLILRSILGHVLLTGASGAFSRAFLFPVRIALLTASFLLVFVFVVT